MYSVLCGIVKGSLLLQCGWFDRVWSPVHHAWCPLLVLLARTQGDWLHGCHMCCHATSSCDCSQCVQKQRLQCGTGANQLLLRLGLFCACGCSDAFGAAL